MRDYEYIQLRRLKSYRGTEFTWDKHKVTLRDIKQALKDNVSEVNEIYASSSNYFEREQKSKEWHLGRIIYFINHPDKIDPIELDNECWGSYGAIMPIPIIEDGHHRYLALIYLNPKWIKVNYSGRRDVFNYLNGKLNEIPA